MRCLLRREAKALGLPVGAILGAARLRAGLPARRRLSAEERAREAEELARGFTAERLLMEQSAREAAARAARELGAKMRPGKIQGARTGPQRVGPRVEGWGGRA